MGDFRFSLKGRFSMGDVEEPFDMWLNYSPGNCIMDERVHEMFEDFFDRGHANISNALYKADAATRETEKRDAEDKVLQQAEEIKAKRALSVPDQSIRGGQ